MGKGEGRGREGGGEGRGRKGGGEGRLEVGGIEVIRSTHSIAQQSSPLLILIELENAISLDAFLDPCGLVLGNTAWGLDSNGLEWGKTKTRPGISYNYNRYHYKNES